MGTCSRLETFERFMGARNELWGIFLLKVFVWTALESAGVSAE